MWWVCRELAISLINESLLFDLKKKSANDADARNLSLNSAVLLDAFYK